MMGRRWMTTLRKLPTRRPRSREQRVKARGELARNSGRDMGLDYITKLKNWEVHGNDKAADEDT
jgi:hypothetical protein